MLATFIDLLPEFHKIDREAGQNCLQHIRSGCNRNLRSRPAETLLFQPMRELEFLGSYPLVPKMQISARFVNNWHYSVKQ